MAFIVAFGQATRSARAKQFRCSEIYINCHGFGRGRFKKLNCSKISYLAVEFRVKEDIPLEKNVTK